MKSPLLEDRRPRPEHGPPAEARTGKRARHETESRLHPGGRNKLAFDSADEPEALLGGALGASASRSVDFLLEEGDVSSRRIVGSGDRAHHLALAPGAARSETVPPVHGREPLVLPLRPQSRAECRRRCGRGGFCDPASDLGCGGEYCGNAVMRESL